MDRHVGVRRVQPRHTTGAAESFGYKQLLFEPFVGGGFITALAVPIVHTFGAGVLLVISTAGAVAMILLGFRLARSERGRDASGEATAPTPAPVVPS